MMESRLMHGTHECGGDAAAYALGALEPAEAKTFERHLDECVVCRDEVAALQQVVHALPMAAPQHAAPKRLRRRVLQTLSEDAKPTASSWRRPRWAAGQAWARRGVVVVGACAAAALALVVGLEISAGGGGVRVINAQVAGISGSASLRLSGAHGELIVHHLSPPPRGDIYQVWLQRPRSAPSPTGVLFSVTSSGSADVGLPENLRGVRQVMVTPEPDGGSPAPTHKPVIVAPLT